MTGEAMIATPEHLIEAPEAPAALAEADLLSDVLSHVRLCGAIFLRGEYSAPWAFDSPESDELRKMLAPGAERLVLFHIIREGRAWVSAEGQEIEAVAGDIVVLPYGHRHVMGSPEATDIRPIAELLPPPPWPSMPVCRFAGGGDNTGLVCGYLQCDELLFNAFLRRLPPLFRVRPEPGPAADWMAACVAYALTETEQPRQGRGIVMTRLPELLFVEALRLFAEQGSGKGGWLAALKDPVAGRALGLLHADPAHGWTTEELARRAATSRSVLGERFRALLGQSPIQYLTQWRMQVAADLLRTTGLKLSEIAERCGYGSEEAFSRAFRRQLGQWPAHWRETQRS
jgi:AraC-like DNA-binding protein